MYSVSSATYIHIIMVNKTHTVHTLQHEITVYSIYISLREMPGKKAAEYKPHP